MLNAKPVSMLQGNAINQVTGCKSTNMMMTTYNNNCTQNMDNCGGLKNLKAAKGCAADGQQLFTKGEPVKPTVKYNLAVPQAPTRQRRASKFLPQKNDGSSNTSRVGSEKSSAMNNPQCPPHKPKDPASYDVTEDVEMEELSGTQRPPH